MAFAAGWRAGLGNDCLGVGTPAFDVDMPAFDSSYSTLYSRKRTLSFRLACLVRRRSIFWSGVIMEEVAMRSSAA
jgi:hypothetical protein